MTLEAIVKAALARVGTLAQPEPVRAVLYRRVAARLRQLAMQAAAWSADYLGTDDALALVDGVADLRDLSAEPLQITDVLVEGGALAGARVSLVPVNDLASGVAPRLTLRDRALRAIDTSAAGVDTLRVFYTAFPPEPCDAEEEPELSSAFHELFVVDLTKHLLAGSQPERLAALDEEEAGLLADFERYVRGFNAASAARFGSDAR